MAATLHGLVGERLAQTESGTQVTLTYLVKYAKSAGHARAAVRRQDDSGALALGDSVVQAPVTLPGQYDPSLILRSVETQPVGIESLRPDPDAVNVPHPNVLLYEVALTFAPPGGSTGPSSVQETHWSIGVTAVRVEVDLDGRTVGERYLCKRQLDAMGQPVKMRDPQGRSLVDPDAQIGADLYIATLDFDVRVGPAQQVAWHPSVSDQLATRVNSEPFVVTPRPGASPITFNPGYCQFLGTTAAPNGPNPHDVIHRFTAGYIRVPRAEDRDYPVLIWDRGLGRYQPFTVDPGAFDLPLRYGRHFIFAPEPEEITEDAQGNPLPQPRPPKQDEVRARVPIAMVVYKANASGDFSALGVT